MYTDFWKWSGGQTFENAVQGTATRGGEDELSALSV